jgi:hypothetical protein
MHAISFEVADPGGAAHPARLYSANSAATRGVVLVLAHGAGAGQSHPFMVRYAQGLAERGIDVVTFDFPYIRAGRRAPDRAPVLEDAFRRVVTAAGARQELGARRLFIGGKSMGGRMATHLGAAGVDGLRGIVALGYPLHPPGRPDRPRTAHLPAIVAPVLIVQGERDAFGTPDELRPVIDTMQAPVRLHPVPGGDHSLAIRGRPPDEVLGEVLDVVHAWMADT